MIPYDELQARYLDSDSPLAHEFRPGIILPDSCLVCGAPQAALWHVGGSK